MGPDELSSFAERAADAVAESSELGLRNTQLRLVEPFLECLGWDVRSPAVEAAFDVEGHATVDYALLVDGQPAVFVDTLPCEESLDPGHGESLLTTMRAAGVEWGILTNGRRFAFVALRAGDEDGFTCSLSELPGHADALARFTPERAGEYVRGREQRLAAAAAIAESRDKLATAVVAELRSAAGEHGEALDRETLRQLADSFLAEVLATIAPEEGASPADGTDVADGEVKDPGVESVTASTANRSSGDVQPEEPTGGGAPAKPAGDDQASGSDDGGSVETETGQAANGPGDTGHGVEGASPASLTDDGEYVARLFKDRTSIGAVGGSSVAGTMKEIADYLLEQHHLDAGLSLPYVPEDGGYAVLNRVPRHPNGEPMGEYVQLDSGPYLWTGGSLEGRRERIETLAREAGLRVMFQGDWRPRR